MEKYFFVYACIQLNECNRYFDSHTLFYYLQHGFPVRPPEPKHLTKARRIRRAVSAGDSGEIIDRVYGKSRKIIMRVILHAKIFYKGSNNKVRREKAPLSTILPATRPRLGSQKSSGSISAPNSSSVPFAWRNSFDLFISEKRRCKEPGLDLGSAMRDTIATALTGFMVGDTQNVYNGYKYPYLLPC
jgi:hypothetical protein